MKEREDGMERAVDDLHKEEWTFWYNDGNGVLYLDGYTAWERKTRRHGWKAVTVWRRLDRRDNTMAESDVPFTDEIRERAKKEFADRVRVDLWRDGWGETKKGGTK